MSTPNLRLAEHYRQQIRDGKLRPGDKLPTVRDMAEEHGVATATVRAGLSWLRTEGWIVTTQRGSWVADEVVNTAAPADRLERIRRTGSVLGDGETKRVVSAALIIPPLYVAELFDQDPREQVVRREYVIGTGAQRLALEVDWYPAAFAEQVPDLLGAEPGPATAEHPGRGNDLLRQIEQATGRTVTNGRDAMHGRTADQREAGHLGIAVGAPILAGTHEWSDDQGVMVYGEWCLPERLTIGYEYKI
ncbi:GntR family transcriptional regulator [Streptomyces piniterrae]|uniref:GntR family transcriptional regulator n=1 Tax=Streptomyces piniterrae TaxID=2571125 RepID=A0A4U0NML2_9ACTN|nr:GntR family transcriptional regulator [Streptomyces piniterrae]TJZ55625.1 GntR family transcriptional regulator [Streptomyces piniterrae]